MQQTNKIFNKMVEPLKTGELLVKEGFICPEDIERALSIQENPSGSMTLKTRRFLGMILCDLNLITPVDNFFVLSKYNKVKSIESALVCEKILSKEAVLKASEISKVRNVPFISLLLKTGQVSTSNMQKLLFDLFHVPFRSVREFTFNEKERPDLIQVLDSQKSLENRMVPLLLKGNTILFGITDPANMLVINQLNKSFPQFRFKVVFIPDWGFSQFNKIIYDMGAQQSFGDQGENPDKGLDENPYEDPEESPDLSLLLKYKTIISDPVMEKASVQTLYHHYEQLHHLSGGAKKDTRQGEFRRFISENYEKITREYQSHSIEFSLKKQDNGVKVVALPKRGDF